MGPLLPAAIAAGSILYLVKDLFDLADKKEHLEFERYVLRQGKEAKSDIKTRVDLENKANRIRSQGAEDIGRIMATVGPDDSGAPTDLWQDFSGMPPPQSPQSATPGGTDPQSAAVMRELDAMVGSPQLARRLHDDAIAQGRSPTIFESLGIPTPDYGPLGAQASPQTA